MASSADDTVADQDSDAPAHAPRTTSRTEYELGTVIGRGGMGEVLLARDRDLGRDVAIKRMRSSNPSDDAIARFLREAKIQSRLDHPSVVPVHELGHDPEGRPYFVMKRLTGVTLENRLRTDALQPLLHAFTDICRSVAFAHSRGIIHRDLKPANIMLGEYGELYVLDWGLARVLDEADDVAGVADLASADGETRTGEVLGTPGYMAPEQLRDAASAGRPADVYALGTILFEILAGEPLHERGQSALASTLTDIDHSPARRGTREVPPELDALCFAALEPVPENRPSAQSLATDVQAYLDGDRDVAQRRALAADELVKARAALVANHRAEAIRGAGRALALDRHSGAAELVTHLMLELPAGDHPELHASYADADAESVRRHAHSSFIGFAAILAFMPIAIWNGVRDWGVMGPFLALCLVLSALTYGMSRRPYRKSGEMIAYFFLLASAIPLACRFCGPLIVAPCVTCLIAWAALMYPALLRRPFLVVGTILVAWLAMPILEYTGTFSPSWEIAGGQITTWSSTIELDGNSAIAAVFGANIVTIGIACFHGAALARANMLAQRKLVAQAWHLKQLIPA
ncbi:MAG: protein kinase [Deltaproteobacteria bacterium]|nr:protein kinase [Deltaproteobacteria bacterium]